MTNSDKMEQILTESERKKRITKSRNAHKKWLLDSGADPDVVKQYATVIRDASTYAVKLEECELDYQKNGLQEFYQNGQNQWGTKKRIYAELHPKYTASYNQCIKTLAELLPSAEDRDAQAEIRAFLSRDELA